MSSASVFYVRRAFLAFGAALIATPARARPSNTIWRADDIILGRDTARHALVEYVSVTCGHCREFHHNVMPMVKAEFIDTGKVRYAMRALPTPPHALSVLGFNMARIGVASAEDYYRRIDHLFDAQEAMFEAAQHGRLQAHYEGIAQRFGLTPAQFKQAIEDEAMIASVQAIAEDGATRYTITSTPTLVFNGVRLDGPIGGWTAESLRAALNEKIRGR
jgi:protein-disulfide isomerase